MDAIRGCCRAGDPWELRNDEGPVPVPAGCGDVAARADDGPDDAWRGHGPTASLFRASTFTTPSSPPGWPILRILAVARHAGRAGRDLIHGLPLVRSSRSPHPCKSLREYKIDHVAYLGPSAATEIATLLGLDTETIYQAVGEAKVVLTIPG